MISGAVLVDIYVTLLVIVSLGSASSLPVFESHAPVVFRRKNNITSPRLPNGTTL